jgi:hypothetical protein
MKLAAQKIGTILTAHDDEAEAQLAKLQDAVYQIDIKNIDMRTLKQNNALHKLFALTAKQLNEAGYSVNTVLNRRKLELINKVFDWGFDKLSLMPQAKNVLSKIKDRILQAEKLELTWNTSTVKEILWRQLQIHATNKESTTKLTRKEIDEVYELYNMVLAKYGIHVPFPSRDLWEN